MNLQDVRTLLDYHYWARDRALDAVEHVSTEEFTRPLGNSFSSLRDTLAHVYWADCIWGARWQGRAPNLTFEPSAYADVSALRQAWTTHEQEIRALVEQFGEVGIQQAITYRNLKGQQSTELFWELLQHVVNHGTYHRGQVTTLLRQLNAAAPKSMDLITFFRERAAGQV
jgi:uncharacterized damage-inducible protein DinB